METPETQGAGLPGQSRAGKRMRPPSATLPAMATTPVATAGLNTSHWAVDEDGTSNKGKSRNAGMAQVQNQPPLRAPALGPSGAAQGSPHMPRSPKTPSSKRSPPALSAPRSPTALSSLSAPRSPSALATLRSPTGPLSPTPSRSPTAKSQGFLTVRPPTTAPPANATKATAAGGGGGAAAAAASSAAAMTAAQVPASRQATRAPPQHHYLGAASRPQTLPAVFDALTVEMPSSESLEYAAPARSPGGLQGLAPSPSSASNLSALAAQAKETSRQRHASSRIALGETPRSMTTSSARPWSAATGAGPRRLPTLQATSPKAPSSPSRAPSQAPLGDGYGMYCEPWRREKLIGQGQFGVVYKAVNLRSGEKLAVKQVRIVSIAMLEQMIDEVVLMCRASFRNQNVVQSLGWSITDEMSQEAISAEEQFGMPIHSLDSLDKAGAVGKMFNIFMEFVERGSIASVLEKEGAMSESTMRVYMRQLLLGLRSLHAAGIAHRDIKCQNLLLSSDYTLKVADFGSAKKVADHTTGPTSSIQGSIPWMSPEVIRQEVGKVSNNHAAGDGSGGGGGGEVAVDEEAVKLAGWKLADVWSVGCTMVEMVTGRPPWNNYSNPAAMMFAIASANSAPALQEGLLHPDGVDFLHQCCQIDPHRRPLVAKLAYHPYMRPENVDADGNYAPRASPVGGDDDDDDDDDNE